MLAGVSSDPLPHYESEQRGLPYVMAATIRDYIEAKQHYTQFDSHVPLLLLPPIRLLTGQACSG